MSDPEPQPHLIRLQRYLAACGLGSRRSCEEFIVAGRVTVDGRVADELGTKVDPQRQEVALDGETLRMERKKYYAVHKPAGYVCTHRDPQRRPRVIDLLPPGGPRLFTVGRLDEASEGLIIVTNDGDLAQKLAHPKFRIYRTYEVQVAGVPTRETLAELKRGMHFAEGKFRVHDVRLRKIRGKSAVLEVVLAEGQNREVRRLFARIGHKVLTLKRIAFGPVRLGALARGNIRELERDELAELVGIVHRNVSKPAHKERPASGRRQPAE